MLPPAHVWLFVCSRGTAISGIAFSVVFLLNAMAALLLCVCACTWKMDMAPGSVCSAHHALTLWHRATQVCPHSNYKSPSVSGSIEWLNGCCSVTRHNLYFCFISPFPCLLNVTNSHMLRSKFTPLHFSLACCAFVAITIVLEIVWNRREILTHNTVLTPEWMNCTNAGAWTIFYLFGRFETVYYHQLS